MEKHYRLSIYIRDDDFSIEQSVRTVDSYFTLELALNNYVKFGVLHNNVYYPGHTIRRIEINEL